MSISTWKVNRWKLAPTVTALRTRNFECRNVRAKSFCVHENQCTQILNLSSPDRTMVYRSKKKIDKNVRIKVDLTKKRFTLLSSANEYVRNASLVKFCYANINCRLQIKWRDNIRVDNFFKNMEDLKRLIEEDV